MSTTKQESPSIDTDQILESLRSAVAHALDQKRRLGQYAVIWVDNQPMTIGDDAPKASVQPGEDH